MKLKGIAVTAAAIASLVALGTGASASASILKTYEAEAPIQYFNGSCGEDEPSAPVLGVAVLKRTGNKVTIGIRMQHAEPYTKYALTLWGGFCEDLGTATVYETGANGQAAATGTVAVPADDTEFFASAYDLRYGYYNDTPSVSLP